MARKPNNQPATAYDYRRAIALVQVLASDTEDLRPVLLRFCEGWQIEPVRNALGDMLPSATLRRLAKHALEGPDHD